MCNRDVATTPQERFPSPVGPTSDPRHLLGTNHHPSLKKGCTKCTRLGESRNATHLPYVTPPGFPFPLPSATGRFKTTIFGLSTLRRGAHAHSGLTQASPASPLCLDSVADRPPGSRFFGGALGLGEVARGVVPWRRSRCTSRLPHAYRTHPTPVCARAPWSTVKHPGPQNPRRGGGCATTMALPPPARLSCLPSSAGIHPTGASSTSQTAGHAMEPALIWGERC